MFSSDPSVQARKEKLDKEEEVRALRGALMAELDAINYYLQQGKLASLLIIKLTGIYINYLSLLLF